MLIPNEDIFQILREATEPLFPSEITARLNSEFWAGTTVDEVAIRLAKFKEHISQLPFESATITPDCPYHLM